MAIRNKRVTAATVFAEPNFNVSDVFYNNYNVIKDFGQNVDVVVNQGGTSSGKTYSLMQLMFILCLAGEKMRANSLLKTSDQLKGNAISIRVVAKHFTSLRNDAMEIAERISQELNSCGFGIKYNKSTHVYFFPNGSKLKFVGLDNSEKAKFGKYDYTYICEATSLQYAVYMALKVRTFQITFIDYNPSFEFWVHKKVLFNEQKQPNRNAVSFRSTYKDNPFLDPNIIQNIESNRDNENWWRVYGQGFTGKLDGLVFKNWKVCDEFPREAEGLVLGLDFGYANDPAALILAGFYDGAIYTKEFMYETGASNEKIAETILAVYAWLYKNNFNTPGKEGQVYVIADSAEPKSIDYILHATKGKVLIRAAKKGAGSRIQGLNILTNRFLYVERGSKNLQNELTSLQWRVNPEGDPENITKGKDDLIDALRYACEYPKLNGLAIMQTQKQMQKTREGLMLNTKPLTD
jgi:phage terminase large subunit